MMSLVGKVVTGGKTVLDKSAVVFKLYEAGVSTSLAVFLGVSSLDSYKVDARLTGGNVDKLQLLPRCRLPSFSANEQDCLVPERIVSIRLSFSFADFGYHAPFVTTRYSTDFSLVS